MSYSRDETNKKKENVHICTQEMKDYQESEGSLQFIVLCALSLTASYKVAVPVQLIGFP